MFKLIQHYNYFKMQIDRNFAFVCSIDIKKFTINQLKKQIQTTATLQLRNANQRPLLTEVSFTYSFPSETLITNVEVLCSNMVTFQANFQSIDIQVSSLANRGHYGQLINFKSEKQLNQITISGAGFTHCIKISLILKSQAKRRNLRYNQRQIQQGIQKVVSQSIKDINVYGSTINSNPSSILLTKLLNISQSFKKYNLLQEAAQTDLLVALSLISARRFVQAAQILRKASKFYLQKYQSSKSIMDLNKTQKSWVREQDDLGHSTMRSNFGNGRILEGNKSLQRAAKIQLLLAQTISHPSLILQKLQAYHRCNAFASGNIHPVPLRPDTDLEDIAINIFTQISNFLLKILSDKLQPFRIAALKSIQFFIQTLGCSIGNIFQNILKEVISTYPSNFSPEINSQRIPFGLHELQISQVKNLQNVQSGVTTIKNKLLLDHYHHLLQTLLSLIGQINKRIVILIFGQIILPSILSKTLSYELKLYLLRFSQKCITISGADLNIQVSFVGILLTFCQQKNINKSFINNSSVKKNNNQNIKQEPGATHNKHVIHNLAYFSHKILSVLKSKVVPRLSGHKLQSFMQWINSTLTYLGQNQMLSTNSHHSHFVFTTIHDFIISIYSFLKYDYVRLKNSPIETVLYFANMAISNHSAGLPFEKIIETLTILLKYHCKADRNFQLNKQIISRILQKSKQHNLSLKQLQILIKVLQITDYEDDIMLHWLNTYLGCIPHSTYDETYQVFSIMLQKGIKKLEDSPKKSELLKKIINTMLDQYTVKGKAHQEAKETLIQSLVKNKPVNIIDLIELCLFENREPKPENYNSKRKPKAPSKINRQIEHHFDSKSYKIDFQMYMQKISLAQLILTKMSSQSDVYDVFMEQKFIQKLFNCMKVLAETSSLKNKSKVISLVSHYLQITSNVWKKEKFQIKPFLLIIRNMFTLNKILIQRLKESKLMYSALYNIMSLFRFYSIEFQISQKLEQSLIEQFYEQFQEYLKNQKNNQISYNFTKKKAQKIINLFLFKEFIKNWPSFNQILYSSWENVRQIYTLLIMEVLKEGLSCIPQLLKRKTLQICKPFILNLITSSQHSQRQAGLKIFGCLLGLRGYFNLRDNKIGQIICENLRYLKPFIDRIYESTYDWNQKNVQIAQNLCEICMSQEARASYNIKRKENINKKGIGDMQNSFLSFNLGDQMNLQRKNLSMYGVSNNLENLILKESWFLQQQPIPFQSSYCPNITQQVMNKIIQFRSLIQKQVQARTQVFGEKQSFMEQNQEQFYDMGEQKAESIDNKQKSQDDQLQFEDLGIIELDDEQWGQQQQKQQRAIQKLPIKKIYKLSPSVLSSSKPQRIRSKRFHQNEFDYRQKIIVDQLEQKQKIGHNNIQSTDVETLLPRNQPQRQSQTYQKEKQKQKKQDKIQITQKMINYRNGLTEPLIIQDFDVRQQIYDEQIEPKNEYKNKQKHEKQVKKQNQKQFYSSNLLKQKQVQKKTKKASSTKKRKASIGKS